ncbi:MAG: succinyl-diaminopimelate desuccinylase [Wenzhouxiangellaceae bacterium]
MADATSAAQERQPLDPLALTEALVQRASISPHDAGCQRLLATVLQPLECDIHWLHQGEVSNVLISHGRGEPHLLLLGHTDVVPPGDEAAWDSDPFETTQRDGKLFGRGVADMKGAVAAMAVAMQRFIAAHPDHPGRISLCVTSDEEAAADHGIRVVAPHLQTIGLLPDYCLVGEPSSQRQFGDTMRIGRRGSIYGHWRWRGTQGHSAYLPVADNPLHRALPGLAAVSARQWDQGSDDFPPTSLHFVRIKADGGADNVTPSQLEAVFNIRNNPMSPAADLEQRLHRILEQAGDMPDEMEWRLSGEAFMTASGGFRQIVSGSIEQHTGIKPEANTGGGTSDGRFFAPLGVEVAEFGLCNASIHKVNEHSAIEDLYTLADIYHSVIERLLTDQR